MNYLRITFGILFFILLINSKLASGNVKIIAQSSEYNLPSSEKFIKILGYDSTGIYILKEDYSQLLEKYDNNCTIKTSAHLKFHKGFRSRKFEDLIYFHDSIYLFFSEYKFNHTRLYVQNINKETLKPEGPERLLYNRVNEKGNFPDFYFDLSLERNILLITVRTDIIIKKSIVFEYITFTEGMKLLWSRKDLYIYNHQMPKIISYTVDEEGIVYLFGLIYEIRWIEHFSDPLKAQYLVLKYSDKGNNREQYIFNIYNKYVRDAKLIAGQNETFIAAGLLSDNYKYGVSGIFYQTLNSETKELKPIKIYNFDAALMESINENEIFKSDEGYDYFLKTLVLRKNGDVLLLSEQNYINQDYDNINSIIAISVNKFGDINWSRLINKKQSGIYNTSFLTIAPPYLNSIKIIYNESAENSIDLMTKKHKSFFFLDDSYLCIKEINENGNIFTDSLLMRSGKEPAIEPTYYYDNRNGEIVVLALRYRKYKIIKLKMF
jgi:hypothetical protein